MSHTHEGAKKLTKQTVPSFFSLSDLCPSVFICGKYFFSALFTVAILSLAVGCESLTPITPAKAIQLMNNPSRADARREGIAALVTRWDFGKKPPYPAEYQEIAQHDADPTVRAMAIRALSICRDSTATKIFINGLKDDNDQIRLESAKALANIPDPEAIPLLIELLSGTRFMVTADHHAGEVIESKDIRIAVADALRQYRDKPAAARALVDYLNATDYSVAWQCHQSLVALTGQDLKYDEGAWLKCLLEFGKS